VEEVLTAETATVRILTMRIRLPAEAAVQDIHRTAVQVDQAEAAVMHVMVIAMAAAAHQVKATVAEITAMAGVAVVVVALAVVVKPEIVVQLVDQD
jgi:hypothetical protein